MNLQVKYSINIILAACLLFAISCGKKKNVVNSNAQPSNPAIERIKAGVQCLNGSRLARDVAFYVTGNFTGTRINGNWQSGVLPNGTISDIFVGVSPFRDLMFLIKVTNGSQVIGYNAILSFCEMSNPSANAPKLISNDRALINFQTPSSDVFINTATSCGYGLIASAQNTIIISQKIPSNPFTADFLAYTSFTSPNCY